MQIDCHVHFLVYNPQEHVWVTDELRALKASFLPTDIEPLLSRAGFQGCVAVEARQMPKENDWLLSLAQSHPVIKGVVGWVDLAAPDITTQLGALAVHPEIKGFRHVVIDEPDEEFLLREDFQRGIAALGSFGFTYDLLILPQHVPAAVQLVRKFPQQCFVLDHLGLPDIRERQIASWKSGMKELAAFPNVFVKLSGLVFRADWQRWRPQDFTAHIDVALELFGPKRLMLGSNWPVCTVGGEFNAVISAYVDGIRALSPEDQAEILGDTCVRCYHLGINAT
jgi:L-fuconolactonase